MRRRQFAALVLALGLVGCSPKYQDTQIPTQAPSTTTPAAAASKSCNNPTQSYAPVATRPDLSKALVNKDRLTVAVSADTYLFGARNPFSGKLEGFDIDLAHAMAQALFGDPNRVSFVVINAAQRIPTLTEGRADMVIRTMTMNCDRWQQVGFSASYYTAGQKLLLSRSALGGKVTVNSSLADLSGQRICAPASTSSYDNLARLYPKVVRVSAANHGGCLVLLQEGQVVGITGDDTVLAGLAAQDPYTVVTKAPAFTSEPYGIAMSSLQVDLIRYTNSVLAGYEKDGRWQASYSKWLAKAIGVAGKPPSPVYGR